MTINMLSWCSAIFFLLLSCLPCFTFCKIVKNFGIFYSLVVFIPFLFFSTALNVKLSNRFDDYFIEKIVKERCIMNHGKDQCEKIYDKVY